MVDISYQQLGRMVNFIEKSSGQVYAENPSELHTDITEKAVYRLHELYPVGPECSILDVGCGQGPALKLFTNMGAKPHGVTLSQADIDACKAQGFDVSCMDQSFLDFNDESFDVIWARHVVEHSLFPLFTLSEFYRLLKPGGMLYLEVPAPDTQVHHERNPNHYSVLTKSSWQIHLSRCGFTPVEELTFRFEMTAGPDEYWGFYYRKSENCQP